MTQRANILEELKDMNSKLAEIAVQQPFDVPDGYFDQLPILILSRVKALEAITANDELKQLSPLLASASKQIPYSIPGNYFEELNSEIVTKNFDSAKEEIASISPLLSGLQKEIPYSVPAGYFESLPKLQQEKTKVVSLGSRKWFRYAAAAVITAAIATTGFMIYKDNQTPKKQLARIEKNADKFIHKSSDEELIDFIEYTSISQDVAKATPSDDVKELLKDIPATELQEFIDDVADPSLLHDEKESME